jgi:hypothetical protein
MQPPCIICNAHLASILRSLLFKVVKLHDFRHDESLLKVAVDPAGRLRRLGVLLDRPGLDLVGTAGEKVLQAEGLVALNDDLVQGAVKKIALIYK